MIKAVVAFAKKNWLLVSIVVAALAAFVVMHLLKKKEGYCSSCSESFTDFEYEGCSTCNATDAGIILDSEEDQEEDMETYSVHVEEGDDMQDAEEDDIIEDEEEEVEVEDEEQTEEQAEEQDAEDTIELLELDDEDDGLFSTL